MVETLGRTRDRIFKRIFSKENAIVSMEGDSEEIKTALQVRIQGTVKDKDVDYYIVHIWLVFDAKKSKQLRKRYSNFLELKEGLESQGYDNLPNLPSKKISLLFRINQTKLSHSLGKSKIYYSLLLRVCRRISEHNFQTQEL